MMIRCDHLTALHVMVVVVVVHGGREVGPVFVIVIWLAKMVAF